MISRRRRTFGAEVLNDGVDFCVSAPRRQRATLVLDKGDRRIPMTRNAAGRFSCFVPELRAGALYRFQLDDDARLFPDPASRFQPTGPHGASEVVDPRSYDWRDASFKGAELRGQVAYEMHLGTFTKEGTAVSAARELAFLADTGITLIELMPLAAFSGQFGWGYDGVCMYAPAHLYGQPDDIRHFVDEAHRHGIAVILDVVYNHFGPDGNYMREFSNTFFSKEKNDWGECINFDEEGAADVREFYIDNAAYWIEEYRFDGLRLDATQDIHDRSERHILRDIVERARERAGNRSIIVVAENEPQHADYVRPVEEGGHGIDALWNDDFHHSAVAAATGHTEAYYSDTVGTPQELISALKWGYLYQGQYYAWQKKPRGHAATDLPAPHFVTYLQNHDQIANSARGLRLHALTSPGRSRALKAVMLLAPGTPMLFQGQEFDASTPFFYFADNEPELGKLVRDGRSKFLSQFPSTCDPSIQSLLPDPSARETFERSKLDLSERESHAPALHLTKSLLSLRRSDVVFNAQNAEKMHGSVLAPEAFALRFFGEGGDDRLVLVNLGRDLSLERAPEPLLAPPRNRIWKQILSTEDAAFGGSGTPPLERTPFLYVHGHSTLVLAAVKTATSGKEK